MGTRIQNFIPSWFSVIMGTGILPIVLMLGRKEMPIYGTLAKVFFVFSVLLFFVVLIPWLLRFFMYPQNIKKDFLHPILGSFFPTMPISLLTLSVGFLSVGEHMIGKDLAVQIATWLFVAGTAGIFLLGFIILPIIFTGENTSLKHANFGWFIPPVSHLFITIVGLDLIKYYTDKQITDILFLVSMIAFGVGIVLFVFVGSAVYHRYIYHELPSSSIASTFFIGMVPTAKVAIISVKSIEAFQNTSYHLNPEVVETLAKLIGVVSWGFSIWWFILAIVILIEKIIKNDLPFALSWWAFAFPIGALGVATGALDKIVPHILFTITLHGLIVIFFGIWILIAVNTILGIRKGSLCKAH